MVFLKRFLLALLASFILLLLVIFFGPTVDTSVTLTDKTLPDDIEAYLEQTESQFDDLTPNTEKNIVWAGEPGEKTPLSVVYLHGFSATRQETAPLTEQVGRALGANVFNTRFTGHGRSNEAMLEGSVNAWMNDAHEAMAIGRRLGDKVVVIGVSTGGTAASWIAANDPADIEALILMSPNFGPKDSRSGILTWPWGRQLAEAIIGPERSWTPDNEDHARYWTYEYPTPAILPMAGLVAATQDIDLSTINAPSLWIYSDNDRVLNTEAIRAAYQRIGSVRKEAIVVNDSQDRSQHVLAGDILSPNTTDRLTDVIVQFIQAKPRS